MSWEPIEMEMVRGSHLLRVRRTQSSHRFSWFIVPLSEVKKMPRWYGELGKGASRAIARGFSSSFEKAQADALAMADAIVKSEGRR